MTTILILFVLHWYGSLLAQSVFLHRYAAHGMYELSPFKEKLFTFLTYLAQGPSYLSPHTYGILHKAHHSYSDGPRDPHSPYNTKGPVDMMWETACIYHDIFEEKPHQYAHFVPEIKKWESFDKFANGWFSRVGMGTLWFLIYLVFAPSFWWFLLLPIHWFMGPLHGFIVNWFGHKKGYRNFSSDDKSRNTLPIDVLMCGELYQNNHHELPNSANFAVRWWEIDFGFLFLKGLDALGVIKLKKKAINRSSYQALLATKA